MAVLLLALSVLCISILSAARAYVGGESQWSRGQKSAAQHLLRYAETRDPGDWTQYEAAIRVPLGDRLAREELDKPTFDMAVVRAGFVAGLNHPDDVPGMARLYRWCRDLPFMARAINLWAQGDERVAQMDSAAQGLRQAVQAQAPAAELAHWRLRVQQIDAELTPLAARFSTTLGEAARLTERLLIAGVLLGGGALALLGVVLAQRAARREQQQQRALRESDARFQRAMVGSSDGFWEWDLDHHGAYFSPRFETLLGYAPHTLARQPEAAKALLHPDDVAPARAALSAHLRGQQPYDLVLRLRAADGSWRWMRSRAQLQLGAGGERLLAGSVVDITPQRQAELALQHSETLFRSLWETTNDAVLIVATDHLIRFANPAADAMFGHAPGALVGESLARVQPPHLRVAHQAGVARHLASGERRLDWKGTEAAALHADGHEFPVEIRFARFELGGETLFVGFLRDITRRKQAEREILQANEHLERRVQERTHELQAANERLLELDRLKSQFLATMSHELRTPLNGILGFTTLLHRGLAGPLNPEQKRQVGMVHDAGKHLLALINDLLDLSRIESGRMELQLEPFDFATLATEAQAALRPLADAKALAQQVLVPPLPMHGDRRKVYQVLLNLLGNAIKFTERGQVTLAARAQNGRLVVEVGDTGPGIAADKMGLLFEAFSQIDGSLGRSHEGTGLGLHLSRKLLALMQGEISVRSEPGQGSTFCFELPLSLPA